ncbi:MAG TPA: hypothetical protein VF679_05540, partial [Pedobacter sp.]
DRYICKQGKPLVFKKIKTAPLGYVMKHYRSSAKDCKNCPFKTTCIGKWIFYTILSHPFHTN